MQCAECGGEYREIDGDLEVIDQYAGPFIVKAVHYQKCRSCAQELFPLATAEAIEKGRRQRRDEFLRERPLCAFLTASETACALGISRQALHKHRRIRRGFIYQTEFCGSVVYLEESVKLFRATGDGRFPLCPSPGLSGGEYLGSAESSMLFSRYEPWPAATSQPVGLRFRGSRQTPRTEVYVGVH